MPHRQQCRAYHAANHIRQQVIPASMPSGQIHLMPLIQHAYKQRSGNRNGQHAPAMQPAGQPNPAGKQGKNNAMNQFVPWYGNQIHSNRLCSQKKQVEYDSQHQQHGCDAQVAR